MELSGLFISEMSKNIFMSKKFCYFTSCGYRVRRVYTCGLHAHVDKGSVLMF